MRQVVIYPGEDNFWVAECPTLPGCISQGETKEAAVKNIREAINLYIEVLQDDGLPDFTLAGSGAATSSCGATIHFLS